MRETRLDSKLDVIEEKRLKFLVGKNDVFVQKVQDGAVVVGVEDRALGLDLQGGLKLIVTVRQRD